MSDASTIPIASVVAPPTGLDRLIACGVLVASVLYFFATSKFLPLIAGAGAAIDVFLATVLPGLTVIMLLWAARPTAFPKRRRRALVAATLLSSAAAATLPILVAAA
jgi:hypothetical protein